MLYLIMSTTDKNIHNNNIHYNNIHNCIHDTNQYTWTHFAAVEILDLVFFYFEVLVTHTFNLSQQR